MPLPRHQNHITWQTAQQGHLGTTRPRSTVFSSVNDTLLMSYIIQTQYRIGTSLQNNGTLPSAEEIPKPVPIRCGNTHGSGTHRGHPKPMPIHPHPRTWKKTNSSAKSISGYLQHVCDTRSTNPPCATSEGGTNTWTKIVKGENTTTHHGSASETCSKSEGEHKSESQNEPRACKKATVWDGTPHHPIWHRGKTTTTTPILWKHVHHPTSKHI